MNNTIHSSKASPNGGGLERASSRVSLEKCPMEAGSLILKLRRVRIREKTCDGHLFSDDGMRICDTAEATPYMLKRGEYTLVPTSRLIQRGGGVYALQTPTILVGTYLVPGVVKCSAQAYMRLYQRIKKARQRGRQVRLVVE